MNVYIHVRSRSGVLKKYLDVHERKLCAQRQPAYATPASSIFEYSGVNVQLRVQLRMRCNANMNVLLRHHPTFERSCMNVQPQVNLQILCNAKMNLEL